MFKHLLGAVIALLIGVGAAIAAPEPELTPEEKVEVARLIALRDSLKPQRGVIALPGAKARLNLGTGYYFLGAADARRVLTEGWGNPPDAVEGVLGLVFPEGKSFVDDTWGAIVTYTATDYVDDNDAKTTNYDEVLDQMREGEAQDNEARKKEGYAPIVLVGWAQAPTYDAARHDLIWARELRFGEQADHTLNYDVRHLGRYGVLSLNMVSTMSQLPAVRTSAQALAKTAEFDTGARYADFQEGDKKAGYGLAGLVAAGAAGGAVLAKKAGLLAILLAFAKKGFAFIAVGGAALFAWVRKRFGKDKAKDGPSTISVEPDEPQSGAEALEEVDSKP